MLRPGFRCTSTEIILVWIITTTFIARSSLLNLGFPFWRWGVWRVIWFPWFTAAFGPNRGPVRLASGSCRDLCSGVNPAQVPVTLVSLSLVLLLNFRFLTSCPVTKNRSCTCFCDAGYWIVSIDRRGIDEDCLNSIFFPFTLIGP